MDKRTDEQLVEDAGRVVIGTPSGLLAQQAQLEMMRRLKDTIEKANESTDRFNQTTFIFSVVVIFLTLAQVFIALLPLFSEVSVAVSVFDGILFVLMILIWNLEKQMKKGKKH